MKLSEYLKEINALHVKVIVTDKDENYIEELDNFELNNFNLQNISKYWDYEIYKIGNYQHPTILEKMRLVFVKASDES